MLSGRKSQARNTSMSSMGRQIVACHRSSGILDQGSVDRLCMGTLLFVTGTLPAQTPPRTRSKRWIVLIDQIEWSYLRDVHRDQKLGELNGTMITEDGKFSHMIYSPCASGLRSNRLALLPKTEVVWLFQSQTASPFSEDFLCCFKILQ